MTQPSTPTLTPVVGLPATITRRSQVTGVVTYDGPYLGGPAGAGIGSVPITWSDAAPTGWRNTNTNDPLTLPLARTDIQGATAPDGYLLVDLTWVDESGVRQSEQLRYRPQAGPDGLLDLTRDQAPVAVVATPDLLGAIEQAAQIPPRIAELDDALNAIPGQVAAGLAPVAPALAGIAEAQADLTQRTQDAQELINTSQGQISTVLALADLSFAYAAAQSAAGISLAQDGWAVWPVEGYAAVEVESNTTTAPLTVLDLTDGTAEITYDALAFDVTTEGDAVTLTRRP